MTLETPKTRKVYTLNGEEFSSKFDITRRCRGIVKELVKVDKSFVQDELDEGFLRALFAYHPQLDSKNINDETIFTIGFNRCGTWSFYLETPNFYEDGRSFKDDISYVACISNKSLTKQITY